MDLATVRGEFQNFLNFYQVDHITSSPHYPQSNGFTEALVGITKKLMDKSLKEGKPWNFGLLQYRTTPISSTLLSPLEMLTGRKPHLNLPSNPIQHKAQHGQFQDSQGIAEKTTHYVYFHRSHRIGTWTTSVCQGSAWETFGEQLPLINQLLNQIPTGSGFQTTPS